MRLRQGSRASRLARACGGIRFHRVSEKRVLPACSRGYMRTSLPPLSVVFTCFTTLQHKQQVMNFEKIRSKSRMQKPCAARQGGRSQQAIAFPLCLLCCLPCLSLTGYPATSDPSRAERHSAAPFVRLHACWVNSRRGYLPTLRRSLFL